MMRPDDALLYLKARINTDLPRAARASGDPSTVYDILYMLSKEINAVIDERLEAAYGIGFDPDLYLDGTPVHVTAKSAALDRVVNRVRKPGDPQEISDAEKAWLEGKDLEK